MTQSLTSLLKTAVSLANFTFTLRSYLGHTIMYKNIVMKTKLKTCKNCVSSILGLHKSLVNKITSHSIVQKDTSSWLKLMLHFGPLNISPKTIFETTYAHMIACEFTHKFVRLRCIHMHPFNGYDLTMAHIMFLPVLIENTKQKDVWTTASWSYWLVWLTNT